MVHGSLLLALASALVAQRSRLMAKRNLARGLGAWGTLRQTFSWPRATSLEARANSLEHEAMSNEPFTIDNRLMNEMLDYFLRVLNTIQS